MTQAEKYLKLIETLRENVQAENRIEAEICSAVCFLLRRERERELEEADPETDPTLSHFTCRDDSQPYGWPVSWDR